MPHSPTRTPAHAPPPAPAGASSGTPPGPRTEAPQPAPYHVAPKSAVGETLLDVKGLGCPLPVLRANRALRAMKPGERLRVLATDRASVPDFHAFCRETGHALVAFGEEGGTYSFVLRRRPDPTQPGQEPEPASGPG